MPRSIRGDLENEKYTFNKFLSQSEKKKGPISTDVSVFFLVIESSVITYTNTYRYVKKTPPKKEKTAPNKWFSLV